MARQPHSRAPRLDQEKACLEFLRECRWRGNPVCTCGRMTGSLQIKRRLWACSGTDCGKHTSLTKGLIFEHSKKPLALWFRAIQAYLQSEGGLTPTELRVYLPGTSYRTAWLWIQKLRQRASSLFVAGPSSVEERALWESLRTFLIATSARVPKAPRIRPKRVMLGELQGPLLASLQVASKKVISTVSRYALAWSRHWRIRDIRPDLWRTRLEELGFWLMFSPSPDLQTFLFGSTSPPGEPLS